ncbi:MAG: hypothetical protein EAZ81_12655 [Verrucomicrobia bacterium]|nr:MAG: hypothetical protein EAZ81_12655 [Verrucomicrobiota bacterium]
MIKKIVLLGSTGSIGCSTLKVAKELPDEFEIIALGAHSNVDKLAAQVRETGVKHVALYQENLQDRLRALIPDDVTIHLGAKGLEEIARLESLPSSAPPDFTQLLRRSARARISRLRARKSWSWPAKLSLAKQNSLECRCCLSIASTMRFFNVSMAIAAVPRRYHD